MVIFAYIATFLLLLVLPILFIIGMIKPKKFQKLFRKKKATRLRVLGSTSLVALMLFLVIALTAPPETEADKTARQEAAAQKLEENKLKDQEKISKTQLGEQTKIAEARHKQEVETDKNNAKKASAVDLHNSKVRKENSDTVFYSITPNSFEYDVRLTLLDANKKPLTEKELNHARPGWSVKTNKVPHYDGGSVKYLTYAVSVGGKYYDSKKILDINQDYKNYPKLADAFKVTNSKIVKKNNQYTYNIGVAAKKYDVKLEFLNGAGQVVYTKLLNHADKSWSVLTKEAPVSKAGQVAYIRTLVSIDTRYYPAIYKISPSNTYVDEDAIAETARQAELARQAEASRQAATEVAARQQIRQQAQVPQVSSTYYKNCTAVRNAGAAPIYRGQPGYGSHLDRDNDGIGCEN
jgi:hypothetical protein